MLKMMCKDCKHYSNIFNYCRLFEKSIKDYYVCYYFKNEKYKYD